LRADLESPDCFLNRELSWLGFARRVLAMVEDGDLPLLERLKFAGIVGMLYDEFFMKRISGLKRQMKKRSSKLSIDGRTPAEEFAACREELLSQTGQLDRIIREELRPALAEAGVPILDHADLDDGQQEGLRHYFRQSVQPILTPLAVDAEHPFPFLSNLGLNLGVLLPEKGNGHRRFVRVKVPNNRPRWVPLKEGSGFVPLEQVIAANLDLMFPAGKPDTIFFFRVTRGADGDAPAAAELTVEEALQEPGSIVGQVTGELKARRFAGIVRLEIDESAPKRQVKWITEQLDVTKEDVYRPAHFLGVNDLTRLEVEGHEGMRLSPHTPVVHPRLRDVKVRDHTAIFEKIRRGDILLHHPYQDFDSSVLRFIESAALDPAVLAIKLTIYRTSADSPIVRALAEAARRGKQVAVLVEITARFDEAPNIEWGRFLEREGVHVAYGVERLKTHVKLALVVREEQGEVRRYLHFGTGNYHSGTARIYEDLGVLTCNPEICDDAADLFNALTGATAYPRYRKMLVAPHTMRKRFTELIAREAEHAQAGRPCGIVAKMNQLQDPEIIRELYRASRAGVPVTLNVRGLCCLRPGVPGVSDNIRVFGVVGRFLEHSRIFRFDNAGEPEYFIGSADWMRRNLNNRVETIVPLVDPGVQREVDAILEVYEQDNVSAWDCDPEGGYARRRIADRDSRRAAQEIFIAMASRTPGGGEDGVVTPFTRPAKRAGRKRDKKESAS
jgi:polyphosphate kinase